MSTTPPAQEKTQNALWTAISEKMAGVSQNKLKRARLIIGLFLVVLYILFVFLIIHTRIIMYENPLYDLPTAIHAGLIDMAEHFFQIFPLPPGTGRPVLFLSVAAVTIGILIYNTDRLRKHDNPDTVQGDAKWLSNLDEYNKRFTEPFGKKIHDGKNNMILSQDVFMSMNAQHIRRNLNVFVIGGSGAGKSFNFVGPNIMQANCSYMITDPSGGLYKEYGAFLEAQGYRVKCFNLTHMERGNHYNPFRYLHSDKDIEVLVTTLITNTTPPDKKSGDPFWESAETALLLALIAYLWHNVEPKDQTFEMVMAMMRLADIDENDDSKKSPLDQLFDDLAAVDPDCFAVRQYQTFKMGAGKTLKSILISCAVRLQAFDLVDVANLTRFDDIDLDRIGDEKTALFIIVPTGEKTFNFLAAMMYSQTFQRMYEYCENGAEYSQLLVDSDGQVVRTWRAGSQEESDRYRQQASGFFERAKQGRIVENPDRNWFEIRTDSGELVAYRGTQEAAVEELEKIRQGQVIQNNQQSNHGQRFPIHIRMILDEFANIGKIPNFDQVVATIRKYEMSVNIILQSLAQMQKMYKDDWSDIAGNCDTTIYLGGGADSVTTEWISKLLGKETRIVMNASYAPKGGSTSFNRTGVELYTPAQLRTMPEDECIVIPKSMNAYRGKKYKTPDHPNRPLVQACGSYSFDPERQAYLDASDAAQKPPTPQEVLDGHGGPEPDNNEQKTENEQEEERRKQKQKECQYNQQADGKKVVEDPVPVDHEKAPTQEAVQQNDVKHDAQNGWTNYINDNHLPDAGSDPLDRTVSDPANPLPPPQNDAGHTSPHSPATHGPERPDEDEPPVPEPPDETPGHISPHVNTTHGQAQPDWSTEKNTPQNGMSGGSPDKTGNDTTPNLPDQSLTDDDGLGDIPNSLPFELCSDTEKGLIVPKAADYTPNDNSF